MSALTNNQKRYLCKLARAARNRAAALARGRGKDPAADPVLAGDEVFRRHHVREACGKAGLRCCSQDDYLAVKGHFLNLLGASGQAFNAHLAHTTDGRRRAEWKLREACQEFGVSLNYAEAICRQQHKGLGLAEVGEKALWQLMFTVRNRGLKRRKTTETQRHGEQKQIEQESTERTEN